MKKVLTIAAVLVMILALSLNAFAAIQASVSFVDDPSEAVATVTLSGEETKTATVVVTDEEGNAVTDEEGNVVTEEIEVSVGVSATIEVPDEVSEGLELFLDYLFSDPNEIQSTVDQNTADIVKAAQDGGVGNDLTNEDKKVSQDKITVQVMDVKLTDASGKEVKLAAGESVDVEFDLGSTDKVQRLLAVLHAADNVNWENKPYRIVEKNGKFVVVATFTGFSPVAFVFATEEAAPATSPTEPSAPAAPVGPQRSPQTGYNTVLWIVLAAAMVSLAGYCFVSARKKTQE